ncbi:phenylalanine--tRNA ligase subunit beta [Natronoglycomyces albus]|uniref:Phenylalanine--tRNA ligase beta subunit n=1 Tax=Natronoglycomyces albus TaxID=2811108 RepID=A0A895XKN5_9ACTN|nr:phenylalanine--tRNA ligase subunit beta [Natronoglycomyces albus]QSB04123.1 phenylalanine--tRNA ligase subunit beta [Natronoglycomyces albus]
MLVPVTWLAEYVALPADLPTEELDRAFIAAGLEVENVTDLRQNVQGDLVVGRVSSIEELTGFKKPIRYCHVDIGKDEPQKVICGATNFSEGDLVVVVLPGSVLPGGFAIGSRKTYGRMSEGMICSGRELGISEDHDGIIVLPENLQVAPGDDARPAVGLDDVVFELAVTPDMGHCFSMRGIAREVAHQLGVTFTDPASLVAEPEGNDSGYSVRVEDPVGCPRFGLIEVDGVDAYAPSPKWLADRLTQAGMRPIGLAVDVTNYVMLDLGHPLHAFDADKVQGELVVRRATAGEKLTTLDDVERELDAEDIVICDESGPVSLAGTMGGDSTEVSANTTRVLMEGAIWDPIAIARTARRHKLSSEASKRYERGVDPALSAVAIRRALDLLVEYGGGQVRHGVTDIDNRSRREPIPFDVTLPSRVAGIEYSKGTVIGMLVAAGCIVADLGQKVQVTPASWRPDLTDPADLVEEVVRLDGYDKIPSVLPKAYAGRGLTPIQRRRRRIANALANNGFVETFSFPFVSPQRHEDFNLPADDERREALRLLNPLDDSRPQLRTSVLASLVGIAQLNLSRGAKDLALFEEGLVFLPVAGWDKADYVQLPVEHRPSDEQLAEAEARRPQQPRHVAALLCGKVDPSAAGAHGRDFDWSDAIEAAEVIVDACGLELSVRQGERAPWHPGRCAELAVGSVVIGHAGELHPEVCEKLDLPKRTCAVELDVTALPFAGNAAAPVISHYPVARIDVALVVSEDTPAGEVAAALHSGGGQLLENVELFDVYRGEKLGEGRKSLAFKLILRASDRTLTNEEAVEVRDAGVAEAAQRLGATLRDV